MDKQIIEQRAKRIRKSNGGTVFAFPVTEDDPLSKYAFSYFTGKEFIAFPEPLDINEVAMMILKTMEVFKGQGLSLNYEDDVRFITYDTQINAPDVTMRRLKKYGTHQQRTEPLLKENEDIIRRTDTEEEDYYFTGIGVVKFSYLSSVEDKKPKAIQFMNEYYKLLATQKYGKTVAAIKQEVGRKNKVEGIEWIEKTFKKYIKDSTVIHQILNGL
jgi:hypothetical protein